MPINLIWQKIDIYGVIRSSLLNDTAKSSNTTRHRWSNTQPTKDMKFIFTLTFEIANLIE